MTAAQPVNTMKQSLARPPTRAEWAMRYKRRGLSPIPLEPRTKNPGYAGWPKDVIPEEDIPRRFAGTGGIGVLAGTPSAGHADVDLDVEEAVYIAPKLLPPTKMVHGRKSKQRSHWWYMCPGALTEKFQFTEAGATSPTMLCELRADGCQTVVPPSLHEDTGEVLVWHEHGAPKQISAGELRKHVALVAAAALIARHWPGKGSRDDAALALSGMLARAEWDAHSIDLFVRAVAEAAGDEEWRTRGKGAATSKKLVSGQKTTGANSLIKLLRDGARVVPQARAWLALPALWDVSSEGQNAPKSVEQGSAENAKNTFGIFGTSSQGTSAPSEKPSEESQWDTPEPLPSELPAVDRLARELVPEPLRPWLEDMAERMSLPLDFFAPAALVVAGSLVGRRIGIHPKQRDPWLVVPNLWGALVAPPGMMKSAALGEVLKPVERLAHAEADRYAQALTAHAGVEMAMEARKKALQAEMDRAAKANNEAELARLVGAVALLVTEEPRQRRFKVNDGTVEKIGMLLNENPQGFLVFRDELVGWLKSLDKVGREGDRAFYLEAWNGTGSHDVERVGRGSLHIPALTLSLLGGIQPGPLASYIYEAAGDGAGNDGLLQRFQLLVWPDQPRSYEHVDRWADAAARGRAYHTLERLALVTPEEVGAHRDYDDDPQAIPALRFESVAAQALFDEFYTKLQQRLRSGALSGPLAAHVSKFASLMPSLALLFHLMDVVDGRTRSEVGVSEEAALQATYWCDYLEMHAHRLYTSATNASLDRARVLLRHAKAGEIADGCSLRDVWRHHWERLSSSEEVEAGLRLLEDHGWVRIEEVKPDGRGRPSKVVRLHPDLRREPADRDV